MSGPKQTLDNDRDYLVLFAAYLRLQKPKEEKDEGRKRKVKIERQQDIADRLGVEQPEVARLLAKAESYGWLDQSPRFSEEFCQSNAYSALLEKMKAKYFSFDKLKLKIDELTKGGAKTKLFVSTLGDFPQFAAAELASLLKRSKLVGVTWGRTLADIVHCLVEQNPANVATHPNTLFIPLSGVPVRLSKDDKDFRYDSTYLASRLRDAVGGNDAVPMLNAVPAYISSEFAGKRLDAIWSFIEGIPGYVEVFGIRSQATHSLAQDVDTILTGVGLVGDDDDDELTGTFVRERVLQEMPRIRHADLKKWVFGDIAGILLPRGRQNESVRKKIMGMNERWVGMRLTHLEKCVERAARHDLPGVVVIARQPEKAEIVAELIRRQSSLVSHLIVDFDFAKALEAILCPDAPSN